MEQHPIPQQISSYQFKLVGDMTLKQFFQLAGGVVISLIFYSLPLHFLIKWPLIIISAGLGAAMAFLPFQERPLEKWIIAFFRSIYSPTLYFWKKSEKPYVFFTEDTTTPNVGVVPTGVVAEPNAKKLEDAEKNFLSKLTSLWTTNNPTPAPNTPVLPVAPIQTPVSNNPIVHVAEPISNPVISEPIAPKPQPVNEVTIPQQIPTVITKTAPKLIIEESGTKITPKEIQTSEVEGVKTTSKQLTENIVEFSIDAAPPSPPIAPNTITGQIMDEGRKIIEGAIMEIKDSNNRPVRALKSNRAGHFIIVTPLSNGKYEINIEKEGFKFDPVSFEAKGELIPPIAIRGVRI